MSLETVFLDRDGTLIRRPADSYYVRSPEQVELLPGAAVAIRRLNDAGVRTVLVTNQRGIALGLMSEDDLDAVHARLQSDLAAAGAHLDAVYHCPHDDGECDCRKPGPGLLLRARRELPAISFASSVMIGDSDRDAGAAAAAGIPAILVGSAGPAPGVEHVAPDLDAAVGYALARHAG